MSIIKSVKLAAAGIFVAGSAFAADLPSRQASPVAPAFAAPVFSWSGFYVGANAGYSFGKITGTAGPLVRDPSGFSGGVQVGANYQMGQFVLGAEADWQFSDLRAGASAAGLGIVNRARIENFGTLRARAGVAFDRALVYATGGYAFANTATTGFAPPLPFTKSTAFHNGWALGAGVEYAITNNVTAKVEYLYTSFEKKSLFAGTANAGATLSTVRGGINYKF